MNSLGECNGGIFMGLMSPQMDGTNMESISEPYRPLVVGRSWGNLCLVGVSETKILGDMIGQAATRHSKCPLRVSQRVFREQTFLLLTIQPVERRDSSHFRLAYRVWFVSGSKHPTV